jgi:hypothetical protein
LFQWTEDAIRGRFDEGAVEIEHERGLLH